VHTLVGGGGQHGGFDALDYRKIKQGNAGPFGTYAILSVLPDKFARFLFEFHSVRFESLNLPILPDERSQFDVHGALEGDKVKKSEYTDNAYDVHDNCYDYINYINYSYYVD
jgi:hypothetical protein